ncbi:Rv3654c family TadE-like protein [Occultella gossypii]|uniref:Flp pilus-assembly TadE/G-like family protein n=1 Tax=Occultella gossypii TaxID=2800820 RepID=A0ABS7SAF6_9MICO|nr:Rv3654c family TadE-like protein [Occultella gossypii]MBZ2197331.1 flp pilus-assembly TadE/G-like family protein [Occultella gossypii]
MSDSSSGARFVRGVFVRVGERDRGSATVLVLAIVAAALILAVLVGGLARVTSARGLAQGAADLAAIAGAEVAVSRSGDPCAVAGGVAQRHGVELDSCVVSAGGMVTVQVGVPVTPVPGWSARATAQARAGPVGRG